MKDTLPNGLDLGAIAPGRAAMYSPNLWKYLAANKVPARYATGFRHRHEGTLWLGYIHDGEFVGTKLMQVLCQGARACAGCYVGLAPRLEVVPDFWAGYVRLGRCFIDPGHQQHFIDTRWREEGDTRTCLWCGHLQHRHTWEQRVQRQAWCSRPPPAPAAT